MCLHDMCTFASKDTCLGISVAYIDESWKYSIVALGLIPHNQGHKAEQVATTINEYLSTNFRIEACQLLAAVRSDTASSALNVVKEFDLEPEHCAMHAGDLVMSYSS